MRYLDVIATKKHEIRLLGKSFWEDDAIVLPWVDAGFTFRFQGQGAVVGFAPYQFDQSVYVRVFVDDQYSFRFAVTNGSEKIFVDGLDENAVHTVKVLMVVRGAPLYVNDIRLVGDELAVCEKPAQKLRLAFVGDSITCGYGVIGTNGPCYNSYEQDSSRSYAYMTAEKLGAEIFASASSGKGFVANCNGDRTDLLLSQGFRQKTLTDGVWDQQSYIPDVFVINVGTNDAWGGITDEEWIPAAVAFMEEVRSHFPKAPIIYCYGMMDQTKLGAVEKAVSIFNEKDGNAYFLPTSSVNGNEYELGGVGHPNIRASQRVSEELSAFIRKIMK